MKWYYVLAGQQAGPVSETELAGLVASGTIKLDTLVWREGLANWVPYSQVAAAGEVAAEGATPAAAGTSGIICSECGQPFPPNQVIQVQGKFVCGNCKPIALQRVQEGVTLGTVTTDPDALADSIIQRGYTIQIGDVIGKGWNLVKANLGISILATFLVYLIMIGVQIIPCVGPILAMLGNGLLLGGLFWFFMKLNRNEEPTIGDAFAGFKRSPGHLMLASIISSLLAWLAIAPAFIAMAFMSRGSQPEFGLIFFGLLFAGFIPMIYLTVCWIFAIPLVIDKEMHFWKAMQLSRRVVHARWGSVFGLIFVSGLIAGLGVLACCVGILVTIPIFCAALMVAYDQIFNFEPQQPVL